MNGLLFVIGSESVQGNLHILAIDKEGKTKWSQEGDFSLTRSSTQLFIGDGRTISSLAPADGEINWSTHLPGTGHVIELFFYDNQIFVSASRDPYFVISPNDGKVIAKYSSVDGFRGDYPHLPFFANVNFQPIILGNEAIFQWGDILYTLERKRITTSDPIWEIKQDSISNSALIGDQLFYVARDDKLKSINASTGELLYENTIEPSIDFFNYEKNVQHAGYFVCSDMENQVLYVILGDSRQLFAFSVAE
jgi:outer membrane protein assembly factor BamB